MHSRNFYPISLSPHSRYTVLPLRQVRNYILPDPQITLRLLLVLSLSLAYAAQASITIPAAPPLHWAAQVGSVENVLKFLSQGIDVDELDHHGSTPLMYAARAGQEATFQVLREHGANVHLVDQKGETLLHYAALGGKFSIFKLLLQAKLDPHVQNNNGLTPFRNAVSVGANQIISILLEQGVDLNQRLPADGVDVLQLASKNGHHKTVELLITQGVVIRPSGTITLERSALQWAALNGHHQVVRTLLDHKVPVDERDVDGNTPLILGSRQGHLNVVTVLLENNALANFRNKTGDTPLGVASKNGHDEIMTLLLNAGSQFHSHWLGIPPLGLAASGGHTEAVKILVENGADPNAIVDRDGHTPLIMAAAGRHYDTVQYLLSIRAKLDIKDRGGMTALMWATGISNNSRMVKLLLSKGENNINQQSQTGETALFKAIRSDNLETIQFLINSGADITLPTLKGETPRMKAINLPDDSYRKKVLDLLESNKPENP